MQSHNADTSMLSPGTRLGPYEISSPLGAGGMGEVYRGRDTRLGREVAIKVLRTGVDGHELRARFEREAKVISSLNHPHICSLFDVGDGYLVMELLEGETLADRLARGPIPLREALKLGEQIAGALARAHREGILHRDLKPGNVMITRSGAKLLDFGLARSNRATENAPDGATEQKPLTHEGTVLGTLQYMAPEQLSGAPLDARADIFSFGAILYEMVTGKRAFDGSTRTSIVAAIVSHEPRSMTELQPLTPSALEHVVRKCLAKEPDARWESAYDVASELGWIASSLPESGATQTGAATRRNVSAIAWPLAVLLVAIAAFLAARYLSKTPEENRIVRFQIPLPPGTEMIAVDELGRSLSPDGERLAFSVQNARGQREMWVHSLESGKSTLVQGSIGASYPFWSPDGRFIAFFAEGKLKKVPAAGGPAEALCDAASGRGGAWNEAGTIIFTPTLRSPIYQVPAAGGQPKQVTTLRDNERAHRFPSFLPDGKRFLYAVGSLIAGDNRLMLGDIESGQATALAQNASNGQYVAPGFLLFVRNGALLATRFDSRSGTLTGEPVVVAPSVGYHPAKNLGMFAAGGSNTLAFVPLNYPETEFRMVDRTGHLDSVVVEAAAHQMADLSPDGQRIATTRLDAPSSSERVDLWVTDVAARRSRRVSTDPKGFVDVRWAPDGRKVLVTGGSHGILDVIIFDLAGKSEVLLESPFFKRHPDLSPDGKWILYAESHPQTQWDIRVMSLQPRKPSVTFAASTGADGGARFSPDGRFIAFMSESGGAPDIYVKRFPDSGEQWQISTGGGLWPRWSPNGRELYYEQPGGMLMAVAIEKQPSFDAGVPKPLFPLPRGVTPDSPVLSGVTPDGKRFLLAAAVKSDAETGFQVVLNWQSRTSLHP